jgi:type IV secretory pathway VirJ component
MTTPGSSGWLPALLCLAAATVVWTLADEQRARLPALVQQLKTAQGLIDRTQSAGAASAEATARELRVQRQAWLDRLATTDNEAVARAQAVFTLRELCTASLASACQVRLSEEIGGTAAKAVAVAASGGSATLQGLGMAKARAVVSGNFQAEELQALVRSLQRDTKHHWRINGLGVCNNSFELDVERHFIERP